MNKECPYDNSCTERLGICVRSGKLNVPNLKKLVLFNIENTSFTEKQADVIGCYAKMQEKSAGKDTTVGHWEIAGVVSEIAMPTYPNGFPEEVMEEFEKKTGKGTLCNFPYSGSKVIADHGCDPGFKGTDHSREYVSCLCYGESFLNKIL